jgi:glycosyltransferase involved in cell wall biosynthesis
VSRASRPLVVSWIRHHGRSTGLAEELGGDAVFIANGRLGRRWAVLWRYPVQLLRTVLLLVGRRPDRLVVMAPPLPLVLLAIVWRRLTGARVVIDAHTAAVLSPRTGRPRRRFAVAARFADAVIVTLPELADCLPGCTTVVLDDPPPSFAEVRADHTRRPGLEIRVVYPCSWYADEPIDAVLEAAAQLPGVEVVLTGRPDRPAPAANVSLPGYLPAEQFLALLAGADAVLALTLREHTMQRAAYEAVAAGRPLVVSATGALTRWVDGAAPAAAPTGPDIVAAIRSVVEAPADWQAAVRRLREDRHRAFAAGISRLSEILAEENRQRRFEALSPGKARRDEIASGAADSTAQLGVVQHLPDRAEELLGALREDVVLAGLGSEAVHSEPRRDHRDAGAHGVEHLQTGTATAAQRHNHRSDLPPGVVKVGDEPGRLDLRGLRRHTSAHDEQSLDLPRAR